MLVSAIIPTYNRSDSLGRTLGALAGVTGNELEIVVVDNASTDGTAAIFREICACYPARRWRYVREPMPGLLSGRHRGATEAVGEICAYLDDDVRVSAGWLRAIQEGFQRPEVGLIGGPSLPLFEVPPPGWLERFWTSDEAGRLCTWLSLFEGGDRVKPIDPRYVLGLNFAIRRTAFFEFGGFHPDCLPKALQRFQGDGETGLSLKLARAGQTALYHPGMAVRHEVPAARLTAGYFAERAFYQGVCDSYTRIRAHRAPIPAAWSWRDGLRWLKRQVSPAHSEPARIWCRAEAAYAAGGRFHREAVLADARLLDWVLRENYLDYHLPEGWEEFARAGFAGPAV